MTPYRLHRLPCIAFCAMVLLFASTTAARAQADAAALPQSEALTAAAKANPKLVNGLAKEIGSTPEQAAGAAGAIFGIAKALLKPEEFAKISQAVPGMDALLAAVPAEAMATPDPSATPGLLPTPGFATSAAPGPSSSPSTAGMPVSANNWLGAAIGAFSKLGVKPDMITKAIPYLSGYLKKHGGDVLGSLLGGVFKTGK